MVVHSYGQILLNDAAVNQFKLFEYQFVVLKINQDEKEPGAKKVKIKPQGNISLQVKSFIEYYKLADLKPKKFACEWDAESKMVVAQYAV